MSRREADTDPFARGDGKIQDVTLSRWQSGSLPDCLPQSRCAARSPGKRSEWDGISAVEAHAAAPLVGDTDPRNIDAGRQAAGQASGQRAGPICPNRFGDVPNHGPSDHPSVAVHPAATRGSTQEAGGSSARGFAG
jgi:hypothetical protein